MRKKILIQLDRERNLRLDLNAMAEFEDLTGKSLFTIGEKLQEAKYIRAMLFVTLKSGGESIELNEVGSLIDMDNFGYISEKLTELMTVSYGDSDNSVDGKK